EAAVRRPLEPRRDPSGRGGRRGRVVRKSSETSAHALCPGEGRRTQQDDHTSGPARPRSPDRDRLTPPRGPAIAGPTSLGSGAHPADDARHGAKAYVPPGTCGLDGGRYGGLDRDHAGHLRGSRRGAPPGIDGTTPRPCDRRISPGTPPPPAVPRRRRGNRTNAGDPGIRTGDPLSREVPGGRDLAPRWREGGRGRDHLPRGGERLHRPPDSMATGRSAHHLDPRRRDGPADDLGPVSRGAPRFQTETGGTPRSPRGPLVPSLPFEAHGEASPGAPGRV